MSRKAIPFIAAIALAGATGAHAADEKDALQEVVVTGSRIALPNMTSTSPVQIISSEEIKAGGRTDISDVLNNLPQVQTNYQGQGLGNRSSGLTSAGGVSNVDLRGLGPTRTLVLVNGRRLGIGSPNTAITNPAPNIDQIPSALVERIDVLTGGASAVYGSDAIAGVVNFVMKSRFTGLQFDYNLSENWHQNRSDFAQQNVADGGFTVPTGRSRDGRGTNLGVTMGADLADGLGNVTAYFTYLKGSSVPSNARDFGACQLFANATLTGADCGGSANANYFRLTRPTSQGGNGAEYQVVGNQFVPWGSSQTSVPPAVYNSQSLIYFGRDNTRYNAGFMAHIDLNDGVKPYIEFSFMDDSTYQQIAPSGLFRDSNPLTDDGNYLVNCSNPLLSAQQRGLICTPAQVAADTLSPGSVNANLRIGRRNLEGGGRNFNYSHTTYRGVAGFKGSFFDNTWSYDAYGQYYTTAFFQSDGNYLNFASIANALQVRGTAANPVCISGDPCIPYNIFREGGVTQAALQYLYTPGTARGSTALRTIHGDITGNLGDYGVKLPWANDGAAVNFGYERRKENIQYAPDAAKLGGLLAGAGGANVSIDNDLGVQEEFVELVVPIASDRKFIKDLLFDTGYRYSDYTTGIDTDTYKFELQYAPTSDVRLRGGYQRAVRAPNIIELYKPVTVGQIQIGDDPCAPTPRTGGGLTPARATLAQCARSGVTAAQYANGLGVPQGTAGQLTQAQSGNLALQAEKSDSYSVGVVLTPTFVSDLTASIDYYDIKVDDQINVYPANIILNQCVFGGDPFYCSQLSRSPVTGGLTGATVSSGGYILQPLVNVASSEVSGIDVQLGYKFGLGALGSMRLQLNGAYVLSNDTTPSALSATYDCTGLFGPTCQGIHPEWQHNLRTTWSLPHAVDVSLTWRYLGAVKLDNNDPDPSLNRTAFTALNTFNAEIAAYNYIDLSATWNPRDWISIRGGINNLFDKTPPIVTSELISGGAANTYEVYDPLGMQLFVGATLKF